ncbi:hypothetical protein M758_12G150700 [Ceratodon purpureus]|nr:hypothetical protein M758_12G150700 [Ceratodon purpureus]
MVALDERHHTFLQALMRRGPLSEGESKKMFRELFSSSDDQFFDFLSTVNKELDYVQMEVRGSRDQYSNGGTLYYGVVNKLANEEAKLGTRLTHAQLSFFKAILEAILSDTSASGSILSMQALNLRLDTQNETQTQVEASTSQAAPLKLTLAAKEETLATLVSENWLGRTENGKVILGTKSFLELRSLFKNFEVPFCDVCNEAAIKAQPCQNEDCTVRMHLYCVPRKFSRRQVPRVCPGCRTAWRMLSANDDAANTSDQDPDHEVDDEDDVTRVRAPASTVTRRATRASQGRLKAKLEESTDGENGNDDDGDASDGTQPATSQPTMSQRRVIYSRKKMKARR